MLRTITALLPGLALSTTTRGMAQPARRQAAADSLTAELEAWRSKGYFNGFGVAIVNAQGVLYQHGFGFADAQAQKPYSSSPAQ